MADDEHVIASDVVKISPDLTGFTKKLQADLKAALSGVDASVKIKLVADKTGFLQSIRDTLKTVNAPSLKIKLTADASGLATSVREQLAKTNLPTAKVKIEADASNLGDVSGKAKAAGKRVAKDFTDAVGNGMDDPEASGAANGFFKKIENSSLVLADQINKSIGEKLRNAFVIPDDAANISGVTKQVQDRDQAIEKAHAAYLARAEAAEQSAQQRATAIAERESSRRASAAEQEAARVNKALADQFTSPKLIDWGGEGIRPLNLLYGAIAALSPALFAMGASAVQASTSVAALGAAGIGAALGIGGLVIAFKGLTDLLALRKTVQAQQATTAANSAATATKNASELLSANNRILDTQQAQIKAEKDLHDARVTAARDLVDLKQKVADLQNQQKDDTLSVAEAQANRNKVYANYFSTALERARADQDVANAKTKLSDTTVSKKEAQQDLTTSVKKGIEGSDKVVSAKEAARQAKERAAEARAAKTDAASASTVDKTTSAAAQLKQKLAQSSPALQNLYNLIDKNQQKFTDLANTIQQGVLPGFTVFLQAVMTPPKGGKSTLQFFADQAATLGGIIGQYAGKFGEFTNSPLFRKDFGTIQQNNATALGAIGQAVLTMLTPITQIITAASPLLVTFSKGLDHFADWFATVIDKASKNNSLAKWFADAGTQAGEWLGIAKNLLTLVSSFFTAALPTGDGLVKRFEDFTGELAKWSTSAKGQSQIKTFFDFFKNLDYGGIAKLFTQSTALFLAFRTAKWALVNPFLTALGVLAAANPGAMASFLQGLNDALVGALGFMADHPATTASLLALLAYAKLRKTFGLDIRLPQLTSLQSLFGKKLGVLEEFTGGGASAATMTVKAAVVNLYAEGSLGGSTGGTTTGGTTTGGSTVVTTPGGAKQPVSIDPKTGKPVYINNGKVVVGDESALSKSIKSSLKSNGTGVAAVIGVVAANAVIDQLFADSKAGSTKAAIGHALGGAVNGAMIGMAAGPVGALIGAGIGALVSAAVNHELTNNSGVKQSYTDAIKSSKSPIKSQMLNEAKAFATLTSSSGLSSTANDPAAAKNFKPLQDYISARIQTVTAGTYATFKSKGQAAATAYSASENARSRAGLETILTKFGWTPDKAKAYADQVYGVQKATDKATGSTNALGTMLENTNKQVDTTKGKVSDLKTQLDKVDGTFVVTVTDDKNSIKTVFNDLISAVSYQEILRSGAQPTTAKLNQIKNQISNKNTFAGGGPVYGAGTATSDSIPAWLSNGEYVMPAKTVAHYGLGTMEAMRQHDVPRFAAGGAVTKLPFPVKLPVSQIQDRIAASQAATSYAGGDGALDNDVAELAEAAGRAAHATDKQLIALISAGIVESGLRNLTKAVDHDSLGFLQQRPSQGWGTPAQLTNVSYAATKFIQAAQKIDNPDLTAGELAADVQRPAQAYRGRYALQAANAAAVINAKAPYLQGYQLGNAVGSIVSGSGGLFGAWPASPALDHGHDSGVWRKIINLVAPTGLDRHSYGTLYQNRRTDTGNWSWHSDGRAVDFGGANQDKLAQFFEARKAHVLELIHRTDTNDYGIRRGQAHNFGHEYPLHRNHVHVAMAKGGQVRTRKYDTGGTLPPGYTLAFNGTGKNETIRTAPQEKALSGGQVRLHRADIQLLAAHIAAAASPSVHMDGRKVAEVTNTYNTYLPAGV